jgi:hypothetical protein
MTEPQHEYMDTGALVEGAVPEPGVAQPPVEAPGSPSSESVQNSAAGETEGSKGTDADLPHGASIQPL